MFEMMSKFISDLEKVIKTLEMMELEILITKLKSKNIELRNIVSLLQSHTPNVPLIYFDFVKLENFPFLIRGVVIDFTERFPKEYDLVVDELGEIVLDLDKLAKKIHYFYESIGISKRMINAAYMNQDSIPEITSEEKDKKYRCSETGYRVPLTCVQVQESSKGKAEDKKQRKLQSTNEQSATVVKRLKWRRLLGKPSASEDVKQSYITYRSCVPVDVEERLSLLGFEMIMVGLLLISGPIAYMRQRRSFVVPGAVRIPSTSPRF